MSKFQRRYTMVVQGRSSRLYTIQYPLTCVFDINRRAFGSLNTGHFLVYNLNAATRGDLQYDNAMDAGDARAFSFNAGYASEIGPGFGPLLFQGTLQSALSYREGPDVVTELQVLDGGIAVQNAQIELSRNHPWEPSDAVRQIAATMNQYGVRFGAVGSLFDAYKASRGVTWIGSTWDVLKKLATNQGGYACIDLQKVYMMAQRDALVMPGAVPTLNASTGLIGTPRRSGWTVEAQMIFEPNLQLMQLLKVESKINPNINGSFSVQALGHRGIISGAKDGGVITAASLYDSPTGFNLVTPPAVTP